MEWAPSSSGAVSRRPENPTARMSNADGDTARKRIIRYTAKLPTFNIRITARWVWGGPFYFPFKSWRGAGLAEKQQRRSKEALSTSRASMLLPIRAAKAIFFLHKEAEKRRLKK